MNQLSKYVKKMSKTFTTVNIQLKKLKEDESNLSESEDKDEASHFHMTNINFVKSYFQYANLDEEFKPCIASLFKQTSGCNVGIKTELDLREVIPFPWF